MLALPAAVLDALLPRSCAGCAAPGGSWCEECARGFSHSAVVAAIGHPPDGLPSVHVAGPYLGPLRAALLAYKERGRRDLARALGVELGSAVRQAKACAIGADAFGVVPIPASRAGLRGRGFDHVSTLLRAAPRLPPPVVALRWRRSVADQAGLDRAGRAGNLAGALEVVPAVAKRWPAGVAAILVDDVVTTGATLGEAFRACRSVGIPVGGAAALLATKTIPDTHPGVPTAARI